MTESENPVAEKRGTRRVRVLKRVKAVLHNNRTVVDCTLRDVSPEGARLLCGDPAVLPNEFQLVFTSERQARDVRVVWRRPDQLGVMFVSEARRAPPHI
ncbi:PilZ domain-containing protein [Aestuariivirga sp.]|uniref:PilZ domain-containing protein n=1 Tax=Aestuariivirga sp. TaxID=2650926 RepID=UPI00391DF9AD